MFAPSYFMRTGYTAGTGFGICVVPLLMQGIDMPMFFVAMPAITLDGIPDAQVPAASRLSNFQPKLRYGALSRSNPNVISRPSPEMRASR